MSQLIYNFCYFYWMPTVKGPTGTASGLESDIDVLLLGVRQHLAQAFFASDAGLLHPAMGHLVGQHEVGVHPGAAVAQAGGGGHGACA